MKRRTIIILATIMGISFISLLVMQMNYVDEVLNMRRKHFEESVNRALKKVARNIELAETAHYLVEETEDRSDDSEKNNDEAVTSDSTQQILHTTTTSGAYTSEYYTKRNGANRTRNSYKEVLKQRYKYEKDLIDEIVYSILYTASDRPLQDRIDFNELDQNLKFELADNDIDLDYHFGVYTVNGQCVYQCADYSIEGEQWTFRQTLFRNDPVQKMGELRIHFPQFGTYVYRSITFLIPSIVFTIILLITFIITMILVFRQKKLSEVKNDFINNMTHEFKTPISTISLAAQMLSDDAVTKSPQMMSRLSNTINDETKRLRFQVEKVLQLSMYENKSAKFNLVELNVNELISGVVHTFALKVEKNGGKIVTHLDANKPTVLADEMHLTNVVFNLMDNAVKYRRNDAQLELTISTWNDSHNLCISIQDNGIGIKKEDVKKIFDKFYRVHTGNRHDVKGFGLGLAYVKKIITEHKGTVNAESELGIGTKFIIKLPSME